MSRPAPQPIAAERLQKILARCGMGSRRQIEALVRDGRITINGRPAGLGDSLAAGDRVAVDGERLRVVASAGAAPRVLAYHKPEGEVCTRRDEQGRPTVFDHLPRLGRGRWLNVGRLDTNTSGLLLFTADGELANRLAHPSGGLEREYAVRVRGEVSEQALQRLLAGVDLDDGPARFAHVEYRGGEGANRWYHVVLNEGRNREVRRLWEAVGTSVSRLIRVRFGPQTLPRALRPGKHRLLDAGELQALLDAADYGDGTRRRPELRVEREQRRHRR